MKNHEFYAALARYGEPERKEPQTMSTALVTPGEINDAADATDLLDQLRTANSLRIEDSIDARTRTEMRMRREKEIFQQYLAKATDYYEGMWLRCGESPVGHNFINLDLGHVTIQVCDTCSFPKGVPAKQYKAGTEDEAKEYKEDLARNLAKQLITLDEKAGVLEPPKDEDFIGIERKLGEKKRWWN